MADFIKQITVYLIPGIFLLFVFAGLFKRVKVYEAFLEGAKEGLSATVTIVPALVGLLAAVGIFRASGALDLMVGLLKPVAQFLHIPLEVIPLALLRPISGSASLALVTDIMRTYGPDSFVGRLASVMMSSTETTFYTIAVYLSATSVKNTRFTVFAALLADASSVLISSAICVILL